MMQRNNFMQITVLLSEELFVIFDYCIHNRKHIEDIWIKKCVLALIFANAFKITNSSKLRLIINS